MKKKYSDTKNENISISLPRAMLEQIDALADSQFRNRSQMIAFLLRDELERVRKITMPGAAGSEVGLDPEHDTVEDFLARQKNPDREPPA